MLALAALAATTTPAFADANDLPTSVCASWGCAAVDIDSIAGGQRFTWALADAGPPDGNCVYLYVQLLSTFGWQLVASSCGPTSAGSVLISSIPGYGYIASTVRVTRGPWPGRNYFSIFNSTV